MTEVCFCSVGQEDGCPRVIQNHLLRTFTVEIFNNGRYGVGGRVSARLAFACSTLQMSALEPLLESDLARCQSLP